LEHFPSEFLLKYSYPASQIGAKRRELARVIIHKVTKDDNKSGLVSQLAASLIIFITETVDPQLPFRVDGLVLSLTSFEELGLEVIKATNLIAYPKISFRIIPLGGHQRPSTGLFLTDEKALRSPGFLGPLLGTKIVFRAGPPNLPNSAWNHTTCASQAFMNTVGITTPGSVMVEKFIFPLKFNTR
jgi:hypothetical protein